MDYGIAHAGQVVTPNGTAVDIGQNDARNAALTARDLAYWQTAPARMVAYYALAEGVTPGWAGLGMRRESRTIGGDAANQVTTWTGQRLGQIVAVTFYRHNFGGRFVSLRVRGTNGAEYYGRASYGWGNVITLRKVKG